MPHDEAIDFFVSYNHNDKDRATWVAATLEAHGYTTCIQEWDFNPGDNLVENIDVALKTSGRVLVILSENYVNSPWCRAEWTAAFCRGIATAQPVIVPVRFEDVAPQGILAPLIYIDLVNKYGEQAEHALLDGLKSDRPRMANGYPAHYNVEYNSIANCYSILADKIVYTKRVNAVLVDGGFNKLHGRITWFADEDVSVVALTPGCTIEEIDARDTNYNFNIVFDHAFEVGEIVEYEIRATLSNREGHFEHFVSTQVIVPVRNLNVRVSFSESYLALHDVQEIKTRKIFDSLMNNRTEEPESHQYANPFCWNVRNPELHFEYQISW